MDKVNDALEAFKGYFIPLLPSPATPSSQLPPQLGICHKLSKDRQCSQKHNHYITPKTFHLYH